jgi:hypothetical protein
VSGALRDVAYYPNTSVPYLAACGLDRSLHVWHTHTHHHHAMYLKLRWNRLLIGAYLPSSHPSQTTEHNLSETKANNEEEENDIDSEEEQIWSSLRIVGTSSTLKRKTSSHNNNTQHDSDSNITPKKIKTHQN